MRNADVVFTQTPGGEWVLEEEWLRPHALIVASGSDQPTKNEIPPSVLRNAKVVTDITAQCARVGELRSAIEAGVMTEEDVHAEIGEIISGAVPGRVGDERIVMDLTGTRAQDAAIGSYVMDVLADAPAPPGRSSTVEAPPAPAELYDYDTIKASVAPDARLVAAVEDAFAQLAGGKVDVPLPMHIGVAETEHAGPATVTSRAGTSRARRRGR